MTIIPSLQNNWSKFFTFQFFSRSSSHSYFNTSQNLDDFGIKTSQHCPDDLPVLEKGHTRWMNTTSDGSRRSSLSRVLETIINESHDNPNVSLSGMYVNKTFLNQEKKNRN